MDASRHSFSTLGLGVGHGHLTTFDEEFPGHHWIRRLTGVVTDDLPRLVERLWSPSARRWYGEALTATARVILIGGLIVAAAFPPWKVTYTFTPYNKEARYTCTEHMGIGPIVGGGDTREARAPWPSGDYRLRSKAPWASFPDRIRCDGYTEKHVGISFGRWLMQFVGILAAFVICRTASLWMSGHHRSIRPRG